MKFTAHFFYEGERFYLGTFGTREGARAAEDAERRRVADGTSDLCRCKGTLSLRGYAARVKVKYGTLKRWHSEGLPSIKVGDLVRVVPATVDAWIVEHHPKSVAFGRQSVIYIAQRVRDEAVKIGWTSDVERRLRELRKVESDGVVLLAAFPGEKRDESALHELFAKYRLEGEWFALPFDVDRGQLAKMLGAA